MSNPGSIAKLIARELRYGNKLKSEPSGAGWYIVEIDPDKRQTLAYWRRYATREKCDNAIRILHIPASGLLSARFWSGSKWL